MSIVIGSIFIQVEMSDTREVFGDMLAGNYLLVMVANADLTHVMATMDACTASAL